MMLLKDFDLANGFAPDQMHGVCLGVVKNMLKIWLNGTNRMEIYYIGHKGCSTYSTFLAQLSENVQSPCECSHHAVPGLY